VTPYEPGENRNEYEQPPGTDGGLPHEQRERDAREERNQPRSSESSIRGCQFVAGGASSVEASRVLLNRGGRHGSFWPMSPSVAKVRSKTPDTTSGGRRAGSRVHWRPSNSHRPDARCIAVMTASSFAAVVDWQTRHFRFGGRCGVTVTSERASSTARRTARSSHRLQDREHSTQSGFCDETASAASIELSNPSSAR